MVSSTRIRFRMKSTRSTQYAPIRRPGRSRGGGGREGVATGLPFRVPSRTVARRSLAASLIGSPSSRSPSLRCSRTPPFQCESPARGGSRRHAGSAGNVSEQQLQLGEGLGVVLFEGDGDEWMLVDAIVDQFNPRRDGSWIVRVVWSTFRRMTKPWEHRLAQALTSRRSHGRPLSLAADRLREGWCVRRWRRG